MDSNRLGIDEAGTPISARRIGLERHVSHGEELAEDVHIQATNDDASACKQAAVKLGYYSDPFINLFVHAHSERKAPEIHIGYWARTYAIRQIVDRFLAIAGPSSQILVLGAGYDTLFWRLRNEGAKFSRLCEVDFPEVSAKKISLIAQSKDVLLPGLGCSEDQVHYHDHHSLSSPSYSIMGMDLRSLSQIHKLLTGEGPYAGVLSAAQPTLVIAECILVYMTGDQSLNLLTSLAQWNKQIAFVNYEQVNVEDKFGHVMQDNLHGRGIPLAGFEPCRSVETQERRFLDAGFTRVTVLPMDQVYSRLDQNEKKRIERIEFLDEKELLFQLLSHYCICVAIKDASNIGLSNLLF